MPNLDDCGIFNRSTFNQVSNLPTSFFLVSVDHFFHPKREQNHCYISKVLIKLVFLKESMFDIYEIILVISLNVIIFLSPASYFIVILNVEFCHEVVFSIFKYSQMQYFHTIDRLWVEIHTENCKICFHLNLL